MGVWHITPILLSAAFLPTAPTPTMATPPHMARRLVKAAETAASPVHSVARRWRGALHVTVCVRACAGDTHYIICDSPSYVRTYVHT